MLLPTGSPLDDPPFLVNLYIYFMKNTILIEEYFLTEFSLKKPPIGGTNTFVFLAIFSIFIFFFLKAS